MSIIVIAIIIISSSSSSSNISSTFLRPASSSVARPSTHLLSTFSPPATLYVSCAVRSSGSDQTSFFIETTTSRVWPYWRVPRITRVPLAVEAVLQWQIKKKKKKNDHNMNKQYNM